MTAYFFVQKGFLLRAFCVYQGTKACSAELASHSSGGARMLHTKFSYKDSASTKVKVVIVTKCKKY